MDDDSVAEPDVIARLDRQAAVLFLVVEEIVQPERIDRVQAVAARVPVGRMPAGCRDDPSSRRRPFRHPARPSSPPIPTACPTRSPRARRPGRSRASPLSAGAPGFSLAGGSSSAVAMRIANVPSLVSRKTTLSIAAKSKSKSMMRSIGMRVEGHLPRFGQQRLAIRLQPGRAPRRRCPSPCRS